MAKMYCDNRGWKYKVMSGLADNTFKARYQKAEKSGSNGWKGCPMFSWRSTFDDAQADLDEYAKKKHWREWYGENVK